MSSYIPLYSPRTARLYIYIGLSVIGIMGSIRAPCEGYNASTSYKVLIEKIEKIEKMEKMERNRDISFYFFWVLLSELKYESK
jgi:hypothetical protein